MQQLVDEAYTLMHCLSVKSDVASQIGDDARAVRLNLAYYKANRRYWRRRNRQMQLQRHSQLEEVAA